MKVSYASLALPVGGAVALLTLGWACSSSPPASMPGEIHSAAAMLYEQHCAACHGKTGGGNGPMASFMRIPPRDFRRDKFRFISASSGEMPTDDDIERFIRSGSRAGLMPAHPQLSREQLNALAAYVKEFRRLGVITEVEESFIDEGEDYTIEDLQEIADERLIAAPALLVPARPSGYRTNRSRGAELYATHCASCHGPTGRGDGSEDLKDDSGRSIRARDLARGEYRGGGLDRDLFWRIRCGIPGTPMPALGIENATDEDIWRLVDYVRFLPLAR